MSRRLPAAVDGVGAAGKVCAEVGVRAAVEAVGEPAAAPQDPSSEEYRGVAAEPAVPPSESGRWATASGPGE